MSLKRIPWITVVVAVLIIGAAAFATAQQELTWDEPQPSITSVQELASTRAFADLGMTLDSPEQDFAPGFSAEEAVAKAWIEEGAPGDPKGVHVTLAILTWGEKIQDMPVWILTYDDAECFQASGPVLDPKVCVNQPFHTIMDATTGEYIASFQSPDSASL